MKYRKLGRTGFEVSDIAHGLWGMSGWSGSEDQESLQSLQLAVDLGCNFFDTAWAYGEGKSDGLLGEILAKNRGKRLYAASKIPPMNEQWPAKSEYTYRDVFPREHVLSYANKIRQKLGTDSIDLLQFHVWDDSWAEEREFRETVEKLKAGWRHPLFWIEPKSLAARKRHRGVAHRAGGCGAGDLQHFRSSSGGQAVSGLPGIEYRRDCACAS